MKSEWVLLGFDDSERMYLGKIDYPGDPCSDNELRSRVIETLGQVTLKLVDACVLTFIPQPVKNGVQIMPAILPISGAQGLTTMYAKPKILLFTKDVPGLADHVDRLVRQFEEMTRAGRARAAGLVLPGGAA